MRSAQPSPAASRQGYLTLWGPRGPAGLTALLRTNTTRGLQADAESTQATARLGREWPPQTTTLALCCCMIWGENELKKIIGDHQGLLPGEESPGIRAGEPGVIF